MKKSLPIGVTEFAELQLNDYYTVDKTLMIEEFLMRKSKVSLITRPRRFGKTSNMNMMAEFFDVSKNSKQLFQNTNIMKTKYSKEMNQYPAIFLSFANCKGDYDAMKKLLFETIRAEYAKYRKQFEQDNYDLDLLDQVRNNYKALCEVKDLVSINTSIKVLSQFLYVTYGERVMIFIDEYDTPFIEAHIGGYYNEIKDDLSLMLQSALKDNKCVQYAMLTGIQRVAKESIFSHLNNIMVFTVKDKEYAPYFGFTTKETKTLLEYYDVTLNEDVKAMYDGYNMGGVDIYNPWSIINYAQRKELIPYWVNASSNTMIKDAMKHCEDSFNDDYEYLLQNGYVETSINLETSFYEIKQSENLWGLLVNAGYLTIDKGLDVANREYLVRIPNNEVMDEFKDLIAFHLKVQPRDLLLLYQGFTQSNLLKFIKAYRNLLLANPSYHDLKSENSYHMFLLGICLYMKNDYEVISNREVGTGRCDIILKAKTSKLSSYILEFKYTKTETALKSLAEQAVTQINRREYDYSLEGNIIYVGLAHCGKEVEVEWKSKEGCS